MMRKPAVLDQLNIVVRDMDAAVGFYRRFGLEIPDTLTTWQAHHRTPETGGDVQLELDSIAYAPSGTRAGRPPNRASWWASAWPRARMSTTSTKS